MRDLHYVSRFGRGIRTVKDELAANGNRPAEFGLSDIDGGCDGGHDDCILRCVEEREACGKYSFESRQYSEGVYPGMNFDLLNDSTYIFSGGKLGAESVQQWGFGSLRVRRRLRCIEIMDLPLAHSGETCRKQICTRQL